MSQFKKYSWLAIVFFLSTKVWGDSTLHQKTPDGRFGTPCLTSSALGGEEVCEVPFVRLLATPEKYDGKVIRVTGYLINVFGYPVLFANQSSFDSGAEIERIILLGAKIPAAIEKKLNSGVWPVYVIGRFDAKFDNDDKIPRLGMIKDIFRVDLMPRFNGKRTVGSKDGPETVEAPPAKKKADQN